MEQNNIYYAVRLKPEKGEIQNPFRILREDRASYYDSETVEELAQKFTEGYLAHGNPPVPISFEPPYSLLIIKTKDGPRLCKVKPFSVEEIAGFELEARKMLEGE